MSRFMPGLGNPLKLPVNQFNDYLKVLPKILQAEFGGPSSSEAHDNRAYVDAQMRQLHGSV